MHVIQYVAIRHEWEGNIDDARNEAENSVRSILEMDGSPANWSDWCEVGGGRWKNSTAVYNAAHDTTLFNDAIRQTKEWRAQNLLDCLKSTDMKDVLNISKAYVNKLKGKPYQPWDILDNLGMNMKIYYLNKITRVLGGEWTSDSCFYDLDAYSSDYDYLEKRITTEPEYQFIVPVDFHH